MYAHRSASLILGLALFSFSSAPVAAQSAAEIIDRMLEAHVERAAGVDDYTLVQTVMGVQTESYFEKVEVEGRPVFRLQSTSAGGTDVGNPSSGTVDEIYAIGEELARTAEYEGRERLDGVDVHVLSIADLADTEFGRNMSPDSDFQAKSGRFYVDADSYVPRRMEFDGEMTNDQGTHPINSVVDLTDYREVEGMLLPWRTVISIEGFGAAIDDETRAQFEEMQRQLDALPEAQRAMMENMMAGQMEQIEAMMSGDDAPMEIAVDVVEVRVNSGPGEEL